MTACRVTLSVVIFALAGWFAVGVVGVPDGTGSPGTAYARPIITPEFDSPLELELEGVDVLATGPLECSTGETWVVEASVAQGDLEGSSRSSGSCSGSRQHWTVRVPAPGDDAFEAGPAEACGTVTTIASDDETGREEWCSDVELITAGSAATGPGKVPLALAVVAVLVAAAALVRASRRA
ncbi:MAG: hypothetical protein ABR613_09260 [Actinomycetota bacterium]